MSNGADRASYFGYGLLAGAVIGLAIGFLYAPKSGSETRAMIMEKADELGEDVKDKWDKAKDKVSSMTHRKESAA